MLTLQLSAPKMKNYEGLLSILCFVVHMFIVVLEHG